MVQRRRHESPLPELLHGEASAPELLPLRAVHLPHQPEPLPERVLLPGDKTQSNASAPRPRLHLPALHALDPPGPELQCFILARPQDIPQSPLSPEATPPWQQALQAGI